MERRKVDTKGFSLVEVIIVVAIMAVLAGIVGVQSISYINSARETKDREILGSLATAAVSAYELHAELFPEDYDNLIYFDDTPGGGYRRDPEKSWYQTFVELSGFENLSDLKAAMSSKPGRELTFVGILLDLTNHEITIYAYGLSDETMTDIFDPIVSKV